MISKTSRRCIALAAACFVPQPLLRRRIAAPSSRGPRARPTPSDSVLATFPTLPGSNSARGRASPTLATRCRLVFEQSAGPVASRSK